MEASGDAPVEDRLLVDLTDVELSLSTPLALLGPNSPPILPDPPFLCLRNLSSLLRGTAAISVCRTTCNDISVEWRKDIKPEKKAKFGRLVGKTFQLGSLVSLLVERCHSPCDLFENHQLPLLTHNHII